MSSTWFVGDPTFPGDLGRSFPGLMIRWVTHSQVMPKSDYTPKKCRNTRLLCINRAPRLLTLNEACHLLPYCGTLRLTLWTTIFFVSTDWRTHHGLIQNGTMAGSPDPLSFQDSAAYEEIPSEMEVAPL